MPNAPKLLIAALFVAGVSACHSSQPQQNSGADDNLVSVDNDAATPAEVEALPADESSATPSNQLVNGDDGPDVNDSVTNNSD
jgi:uncharacterized lipoprotein